MRDGVILYADVYRPVDEGRYPVLVSRTPYSHGAVPQRLRRRRLLLAPRLRVRVPGRTGDATNRMAGGSRSSTMRRTATTRLNGRPSSAGRMARWAWREARTLDRTNGGPRKPRLPAWSPSSRAWHQRASTTTGLRSTAPGACRSTLAGDLSARNRGSCRTPVRTPRMGCTRFTTTRFSGTCRSSRCSRWWDATHASTTTGWPIPTTTTTGSRSTSRRGSTRSRSRCIPSAAGSTFSARARCGDTWG